MAVPNYEAFMIPVLHQLQDGRERHYREVRAGAIQELAINDADQRLLLPSGKYTVADNH